MPNGNHDLDLYYGAERLIFCFDIGTTMSGTQRPCLRSIAHMRTQRLLL